MALRLASGAGPHVWRCPMTELARQEPGAVASVITHSETIAAIAAALSTAQGELSHALKDTTGQIGQQKTKYADLASCWDAAREPLSRNGLAVVQLPSADGPKVTVTTMLVHKSGEWFKNALQMTSAQNTPQAIGSCITYGRRYSFCSVVGISPEDDDGAAASGTARGSKEAAKAVGDAKVAAMRGDEPPQMMESDNAKISFKALESFKDIKTELKKMGAEARYYGVLKTFGAEKSNQLNEANARDAYKALAAELKALRLQVADREETDKLYASLVVTHGAEPVDALIGREGHSEWADVPVKDRDELIARLRGELS